MRVPEHADAARLAALRVVDERAFADLVDELSPRMLKLARVYVTGEASAEDAVQVCTMRERCRPSVLSPLSSRVLRQEPSTTVSAC
jgi:hypothetical protein